jgi:hypothetical protein
MAFPTGYSTYQEVTIQSSQITTDLTDFPIYIDMSEMDKTTDIFDSCRSDGGDIRVTKSDGTTELAREVVEIDTTGKTGELHLKFTGTLSSTSDTVIRVWYNGTDTEPAVTATYGRNAVWSDYDAVYHMQEDPSGSSPQIVDSTGNYDATSGGSMTSGDSVSGKLSGNALDFEGTDDYLDPNDAHGLSSATSDNSMSFWLNPDSVTGTQVVFGYYDQTGTDYAHQVYLTGDVINPYYRGAGNYRTRPNATAMTTGGGWYHIHETFDISTDALEVYLDGASDNGSLSSSGNVTDISSALNYDSFIGARNLDGTSNLFFNGQMDEVRVAIGTVLSSSWISAENNNQESPSTFYTVGEEQGGGGTSSIKTVDTIANASVKTFNTIARASVKSINTIE